jgi:hypothetical protein
MGAVKGDVGVVAEMPTAKSGRNTKPRNHRYTESGSRLEKATNPESFRGGSRLEPIWEMERRYTTSGCARKRMPGVLECCGRKLSVPADVARSGCKPGFLPRIYRLVTTSCRVKLEFLPRLAACYRILPHKFFLATKRGKNSPQRYRGKRRKEDCTARTEAARPCAFTSSSTETNGAAKCA